MPEGIYENRIAFDTADGHTHDNVNSKKIDFARYDLYDFVSRYELEQEVRRIINEGRINPAGGITIGNPFTGGSITLGPEVPDPGSTAGLTVTAGNNPDGTSYFELDWDDVTNADHYLIEMYVSDTGTNGPYRQTATQIVDGDAETFLKFDGILSFGLLTQTYYKFVIYPISSAGIKSAPQIVSGVQASADSDPGARPTWPTSGFNLFLMFRGFITRVNTPVEADIKYGQGQIEWSLTENKTTDGLWVTNEFQTGQQTAVVINVTGLVTGDVYYLRVRTIDTSGNTSPWSYWNGATNQGNATAPWNGGTISAIVPGKIEGLGDGSGGAGLDEIGAGSILAGNIYAGTITADRITADVELVTNQQIRSSNFNATNKTGWQIRALTGSESGNPTDLAEFYLGAIFNDVTIDNSTFKVVDGSNNTMFEVTNLGAATIKKSLTIGDYNGSNSDVGLNYNAGTGILDIQGEIHALSGSFANTVLIGGTAASTVVSGAALGTSSLQDADTGVNLGLTGGSVSGWTISAGKISGGSGSYLVDIDQSLNGIALGGGRAVMRVYPANNDIRIGIDYTGGSQPDYGEPGDITMFYDAAGSGTTKFSVGDKLLFDGTNLTVKGNITASTLNIGSGNTSLNASTAGNVWTGNLTETDAPFRIKNDGTVLMGVPYNSSNKQSRIRIKPSATNLLFDGTTLEFVQHDTSTYPHGYLQGGEWDLGEIIGANGEGVVVGANDNYIGAFKVHSVGYGVVLSATESGADEILLNANQGIQITAKSAPSSPGSKLYNVSGDLYWNGTELGSGGGSTDEIRAIAEAALVTHIGIDASPSSDSNSGSQVIQNITLDEHGHVVDIDIYNMDNQHYTEVETNSLLALKANLSGAAFSGAVTGTSMALSSAFASNGAGLATWGINFIAGSTGWIQGNCLFSGSPKSNGNGTYSCGESGAKWSVLYAVSTTINGSDENIKTDIENATYGLDFVNQLRPVTYKFIETQGRSGIRDHHGFIGQEVEALLGDDAAAMALWTNSLIPASDARPATYVKNDEGEDVLLDDPTPAVEEHYEQGLRYSQFIPILTKALQELSSKLDDAESRLAALEA